MQTKAICSEAVTTMGTIREAIREYYVQYGTPFPSVGTYWLASWFASYPPGLQGLGLSPDNLQGTYFGKECYQVEANSDLSNTVIFAVNYPSSPFWDETP